MGRAEDHQQREVIDHVMEAVRLAGGAGLTILVAATYSNLNVGLAAVNSSALTGGAIAVLLAIFLAVAIARSLSKPLVQITRAAEGLSRGELMAMPSNGGREISVLSATFAEMATQIRAKQALLENKVVEIDEFQDKDAAYEIIDKAIDFYNKKFPKQS